VTYRGSLADRAAPVVFMLSTGQTMKRLFSFMSRIMVPCLAMLLVRGLAFASPGPTMLSIKPVDATTSQIIAHNVGTNPGSQPAISWDIYFNFPQTQGRLLGLTPGPDWEAMDCGFATNIATSKTSPVLSANDILINGFCTTRIPAGLIKDEVVVATLHWADCKGGFVVDLRTGVKEFGEGVSDIFDVNNDPYLFTDADLFDGGACGDTTEGIQTTIDNPLPQASPLATSAPVLALVVGGVILAAAAAAAFLRLRRS